MIEEACYQNQIAVDLFKSAKTPDMDLIKENKRYLYRDVNYIKDKKSASAYFEEGITPKGYSPVELLRLTKLINISKNPILNLVP